MQECDKPKKGLHVYKRLIGYTLKYKLVFFLAIFAMSIFAVLAEMTPPKTIKKTPNHVFFKKLPPNFI